MEQHQREIREEIAARRLAQEVQGKEVRSTFDRLGLWLQQLRVRFAAPVGKRVQLTGRGNGRALARGMRVPTVPSNDH